jgi:phage minor structural protein
VRGYRITGRYIDLVKSRGVQTDVVFEYGRNLKAMKRRGSVENLATALYGQGASYDNGGSPAFVTFTDVVWTTPANPVDKPAEQDWVEDAEATALFGIAGMPRFDLYEDPDERDPETLLQNAALRLQEVKWPGYTYEADPVSVEQIPAQYLGETRPDERWRVGDGAYMLDTVRGVAATWPVRVLRTETSYCDPDKRKMTLGVPRVRRYGDDAVMLAALTQRVHTNAGIWSGYTGPA